MKKMIFVLMQILGHKSYAMRLEKIANSILPSYSIEPSYMYFFDSDYARYRHPVNRVSNLFLTSFTAREKLCKAIKEGRPDILLFNSWEMLPAFYPEISAVPSIVCTDTTTMCHLELDMMRETSLPKRMLLKLRAQLSKELYQSIADRISFFLPMSKWTQRSLERDFRVPPERTAVAFPPVDTNFWIPPESARNNDPPRLLFVGNDFLRKGGRELLDIYSERISQHATLTIVSNDNGLNGARLPSGVDLMQGITQEKSDELLAIYQRSDLFVFPTRRDWSSFVSIEAASTGLPVIATDVGGVGELIVNKETGYVMPLAATYDQWADAILSLVQDRRLRESMGKRARERAVERFSYGSFAKAFVTGVECALGNSGNH